MDFDAVIKTAKNRQSSHNGSNFYKTKFEPPKKENKTKTLSANIQKFLAKKEEEERQKAEDMRRKREELLAMRDTKATNKIKKMLKVIKSANKSVLEDAVDNVNTAVTINGPEQPDEDDYGYVSQEASAFYTKMMEKYKNIPDEEKFASSKKFVNSDLSGTKDRVRAAILRQQEEEMLPHKRKRKTQGDNFEEEVETKSSEKIEEKPKPKRPNQPPPMDFNELLKIAEKKQFEPITVETKKVDVEVEPERLMTKKQKREFEEHRAYKEARLRREKERATASTGKKVEKPQKPETSRPQSGSSTFRVPKLGDRSTNAPITSNNSKNGKSSSNGNNPNRDDKMMVKKDNTLIKSPKLEYKDTKANVDRNNLNKNLKDNNQQRSKSVSNINSKYVSDTSLKSSSSSSGDRNLKPSSSFQNNKGLKNVNSQNDLNRTTLSNNNKTLNVERNKIPISGSKSINREPFGSIPKQNSNVTNKLQNENKSVKSNIERLDRLSSIQKDKMKLDMGNHSKMNKPSPSHSEKLRLVEKKTLPDKVLKPQMNIKDKNGLVKSRPPISDARQSRPFPPSDVRGVRQFPPADVRRIKQFPPSDVRRKKERPPIKRSRIEDDDSEYDSSMDDFIDDGPEHANDVSGYIKEIFGYDKSRYGDEDDDDYGMESNYAQVMKEEYISKKIGLMEDLEDMQMEAMEKKRKAQTKRRRIID